MQLFYTNLIENDLARFEGEEARHIVQVLRYKTGQEIQFIDGKGNLYSGKLTELGKKNCLATIDNIEKSTGKDFHLTIGIAPTKNISRFEWFLEKSTEIGIDKVVPIYCKRSIRKSIRVDRLEKILISATKQSLKSKIPEIDDLDDFKKFLDHWDSIKAVKYIAHCSGTERVLLSKDYKKGQDVIILIGPEGDFTADEIQLAESKGFKAISLGESRLRTETAGIIACHTINLLNE